MYNVNHKPLSPKRITVKRIFMNVNNEVIWQQAEVLAKSIDEAYKNREKIDASNRVGENLIHAVDTITMNINKVRFIGVCEVIGEYIPVMSDRFTKAVAIAINLPLEYATEDKDITFEMFIICLQFHLAIYKRDWDTEDK